MGPDPRALDIAIFYQVRAEKYRDGGFSEDYLKKTFSEDLGWYQKLPKFMKDNNTTFGWE